MEKHLINLIGEKRYLHCVRVMETAIVLGKKYDVDVEKIKTAALLHDCAKFKDKAELLKKASEFDIMLDAVTEHNIELLHGPVGAKIAEMEYKVKDKEILDAIRYHTTGRENMTILDKIIYISDYIEPERNFDGVEKVREVTFEDINMGILLALDNTIKFLIEKDRVLHLDTIKARNYLKIYEK